MNGRVEDNAEGADASTSLAFATGLGKSTDAYSAGITVTFQALTALSAETVTLRNFAVTRFP